MPDPWLPCAERDERFTANAMSGNTPSLRVVVHTTENDPDHTDPRSVCDYMLSHNGASSGYHLLVPMTTGYRPVQLRGIDRKSGALRNDGAQTNGVSPNAQGRILCQISLVTYARLNPLATDPGPWWPDVLDWLDDWDVPRTWFGPAAKPGALNPMSMSLWEGPTSGWCAHSTVPQGHNASGHTDPGAVDPTILWEDQMPSSEEVAAAVWARSVTHPNGIDYPASGYLVESNIQSEVNRKLDEILARLDALDVGPSGSHVHQVGPPVPQS